MNVPNLPTDNLYKFIALFGLVLFGFSFYLEFKTIQSINDNEYKRNILLNTNGKRIDEHNRNVRITTERTEKLIHKISEMTDSSGGAIFSNDIGNNLTRIADYSIYLDSVGNSLEKIVAEENILIKKSILEESRLSNLLSISVNLRWFSGLLVLLGFVLWWFKYQRYMDAETRYNGLKTLKFLKELETNKEKKELDNMVQNKDTNPNVKDSEK